MSWVIYHNPACATSRKVLGFLREAGIEPTIVPYLKEPPSKAVLIDLLARMNLRPRAILRRRGGMFDELGLAEEGLSDAALIDAMVKHPVLIERPIVATETEAVLCRPPERVYELLSAPVRSASTQDKPTKGKLARGEGKPDQFSGTRSRRATEPQTHVMRASLDAKHFRDFEIPSAQMLYDLAEAIVKSFGFDFDHAFGFYSNLTDYVYDSPIKYELFADMGETDGSAGSVKKTRIADAFPALGTKMTFLFDYGDDWQFKVEMIGEGRKQPKTKYPHLLKSVGKAPEQYPDE